MAKPYHDQRPNGAAKWLCLLRKLCLCVGLMASGAAWAVDHITERAWLEDATGQLQWPAVAGQTPQVFEGVLSQGFGTSVIWLRVRIDPRRADPLAKSGDALILRIRPLYLDDIQVFDPLVNGLVGVTGDHHHPSSHALEGMDFMLPIARGDAPRELWLRMSSTSTRQISVQVVHPDELPKLTQTQQMVFALYVAVILIFMVWGLVHWAFSRENVIAAFGLKQAAALLFAVCSLGYARVYWPDDWPALWLDRLTTTAGLVAVSVAVWFHILLIREFKPPAWARVLMQGLMTLLPIKLLLMLLGLPMQAASLNMVEILLAPVLFLAAVLFSKAWQPQARGQAPILPRWVVIGFYLLLVLMLAVASFPGLGLSQGGEIPLYLVQAHGLVTAFLMLLILQYRGHLQQVRQRDVAMALERSQMLVLQETKIREEQDKLLAMLAHELKTPLATMNLRLDADATGTREIRHAIREMNAVIERCLQTAQSDDQQLKAQTTPVDLTALVHSAILASAHPERVQLHALGSWTAPSDPQLLFIVVSNLVENALKYSAPASPVEVALSPTAADTQGQDAGFRLEVRNLPGAAGWPQADQVFEKYYRSPHARRQAGTGLGLYLVSNLVRVLGGRIDYSPDATQIRFEVWLPETPIEAARKS